MSLQDQNKTRWQNCHVPAANGPAFQAVANRLLKSKARYQAVEKTTGVPWWVIAVIHEREASQNFNTQLGQGDPLNKKSVHVPKGRGPFKTWEEGAVDALTKCPPYASRNKDWSVGGALTMLEKYNGLGYAGMGVPSPYVWAGTDQYVKGKYVSDGVYNPNVVDKQLGCAGIIKFLGVFSTGHPTSTAVSAGAGGAVIAAGTAVATAPHHVLPWILGTIAIVAAASLLGYLIHKYRNQNAS